MSSKSRSNKKLARLRRRGTVEDPFLAGDLAAFREYFGQDDGESSDSQSGGKNMKKKYKQTLDPQRRGSLLPLLKQHSESSALLKGTFKSPGPGRKRRHTILATSPRMLRQDQSVRQLGSEEQDLSET